MSRWKYDAADPGHLLELDLDLQPGDEFDAPDDWQPEPNPHPVYKPVSKKTTPIAAPKE
jgi:hypothetical protein